MPVYNITVDDRSPMIRYTPDWLDSNPSDPQLSSYYNHTFHATNASDATASFTFFGNAVYIFGAMREGYGPFSISLDGENTAGNSTVSGNGLFQRLLFSRTGISNDEHTLVLRNGGTGTTVDVDFITFTTGDGNSTTQPNDSSIDDSAPQVMYKPDSSSWATTSSLVSLYYNSTLHVSDVGGARVVVPFTGDAVSLYGSTDKNHGTFSVKIDDRDAVALNGSSPLFRPQNLLYWAGGLGTGQHQLQLTNTQDQSFVDFDLLVATSWTSPPSPPSPSPASGHQSTAKTPIIAGVISGTCVVVAWVVALFFLLRRRRRRRQQLFNADLSEAKPEPFILPPDPAVVDGSHRPGEYAFGHASGPSKGYPPRPHNHGTPATSLSTSSPPLASSSGPRTQTHTRSSDSVPASDLSVSSSPALASSRLLPHSPAVTSSRVLASSKAIGAPSEPNQRVPTVSPAVHEPNQGVTPTASSAAQSDIRPSISASELSASRMNVPNRPQDWGPVIPLRDDETDEGLPPDYQQATQPMPVVVTPPN